MLRLHRYSEQAYLEEAMLKKRTINQALQICIYKSKAIQVQRQMRKEPEGNNHKKMTYLLKPSCRKRIIDLKFKLAI